MRIQSPFFGPEARLDIPVYYDEEGDGCGWFDIADRFVRECVSTTSARDGINLLMEAADQAEEVEVSEPVDDWRQGHCWKYETEEGATIWLTMSERMDLQTRAIREGVAS